MNKSLLFIGAVLSSMIGYSQNTFPTAAGTNVGIGTTAPTARLEVTSGTVGTAGVKLTNLTSASTTVTGNSKALSVDASGNVILTPVANTATNLYSTDGTLSANRTVTMNAKNLTFTPSTANSQFFINGTSGNVGIGNIVPTAKLDIVGGPSDGATFATIDEKNSKSLIINAGSLVTGSTKYRSFKFFDFPQSNYNTKPTVYLGIEDRNDMGRFRFEAETAGTTNLRMFNKSQLEIMQVYEDGNDNVTMTLPKANSFLGIGTTSFTDGTDTYRLAVKGAIRADRVKVYTTWADFVFEDNYQLPTLQEVEQHIKQNGHLKDIPSAKEVEQNGIELGEMNKKLLQKVEELTLYVIEMNKELQAVKSQLKKE